MEGVFQVIAYVNDHQCNKINKTKTLTYKKFSNLIMDKLDNILAVKLEICMHL